jgi:hypothetical protein
MLRSFVQTTVAIAALTLFAVGAKAQIPSSPYVYAPYQSIYSTHVFLLGGGQPTVVTPPVAFPSYGMPSYSSPVVPYMVAPVMHYGYYRSAYYGYPVVTGYPSRVIYPGYSPYW